MKNFKLVKSAAAVALGASVVTAAILPGTTHASAASKYKVSHGKLVNAKTGKLVKGYVVFKSKLYHNGKLNKGYKTVGSGKTIKLYHDGSLKKGYKTARNNKLLFHNGSLKTGFKVAGNGERLYKDGHLAKGYEVYGDVNENPSLYYNGYLKQGYKTANHEELLFYNGKLKKGYKTAKKDKYLYKNGHQNVGQYLVTDKDILFDGFARAKGLVKAKANGKYYNNGILANGDFKIDGKVVTIKKGVKIKLELQSVTVINSKQISVKFEDSNELVTITLEKELTVGENVITFSYKGEEYKTTVKYDAPDTEAPKLSINGEATITVENGADFTLPTVTATDNKDKEVEVKSTITNAEGKELDKIDTTVSGTYTVTFSAEDAAGNKAEKVVVTVVVKATEVKVEDVKAVTDETTKTTAVTASAKNLDVLNVTENEKATATVSVFANGDTSAQATAVKENVAIDTDGKISTTFSNLQDGDYTVRVTVGEVSADANFTVDFAKADAAVKAVNEATNQVELLKALQDEYFKNINADLIETYAAKLGTNNKTVSEIQKTINEINTVTAVNTAENQVTLLKALKDGEELGVFTNVRDEYIETYAAELGANHEAKTNAKAIQEVIDSVTNEIVSKVESKVAAAEQAPTNEQAITEAEQAITTVPADLVYQDGDKKGKNIKEDFGNRLDEVKVVKSVLTANGVSQVRLLESLKENGFKNVSTDLIAKYSSEIDGNVITVKAIQDNIDKVNAEDAKNVFNLAQANKLENLDAVTDDLVLPSEGTNGTKITWTTNNKDIISEIGKITRPSALAGDKTVTLTATFNGVQSITKEFNVTVKAVDATNSKYAFGFEVPANLVANEDNQVKVNFKAIENLGKGYENAQFNFVVSGPEDATATFKATDSLNNVLEQALKADGKETGKWGPDSGFAVSADYDQTTEMTVNFSKAGEYTITFSLIDVTTGKVIDNINASKTLTVSESR